MTPLLDKIVTVIIGATAGAATSFFVMHTNDRLAAIEDVNDYQGRTILEIIDHVKMIEDYIRSSR